MYVDDKPFWVSREWLNPLGHEDIGAIDMRMEFMGRSCGVYVNIWDCERKITLDFSFSDDKSYKERQTKLELMMKELSMLGTKMKQAKEEVDKRAKAREAEYKDK